MPFWILALLEFTRRHTNKQTITLRKCSVHLKLGMLCSTQGLTQPFKLHLSYTVTGLFIFSMRHLASSCDTGGRLYSRPCLAPAGEHLNEATLGTKEINAFSPVGSIIRDQSHSLIADGAKLVESLFAVFDVIAIVIERRKVVLNDKLSQRLHPRIGRLRISMAEYII